MWVCKNLSTGEYLTGRLVKFDDTSMMLRIEIAPDRWRIYQFDNVESAYVFCHQACEEFDLCGFEPVKE